MPAPAADRCVPRQPVVVARPLLRPFQPRHAEPTLVLLLCCSHLALALGYAEPEDDAALSARMRRTAECACRVTPMTCPKTWFEVPIGRAVSSQRNGSALFAVGRGVCHCPFSLAEPLQAEPPPPPPPPKRARGRRAVDL